MQSRRTKAEPNITEAAEKTGLLIRGLQSRLLEGAGEPKEPPGDTAANLEKQLQEYFEVWPGEDRPDTTRLQQIRDRVVDGVAERILRGWERSSEGIATPFESEVIDRLIDRMLEKLADGDRMPGSEMPDRMPRSFTVR
jgi:hypothetical protein